MQIRIDIEIRDEEWNQLSEAMQKKYISKLFYRLEVAAGSVGQDLSTLLFNTKPYMMNYEDNELEWEKESYE